MLSSAKHLLAGYVRVVSCRLYVILSATKDLKVCTTIHCLGYLEILHSVQNDRVSIQNDNTWRHCEAWYKPWQSPITNC